MDKKDPVWTILGLYGAVGFQFAASVVIGLLLGNYLDQKWGTTPILFLVGLTLGFFGGLYNLVKVLQWNRNRNND